MPKHELTPNARDLLRVFQDKPATWLSRSQIAEAIHKKRLNPNDIRMLKRLTDLKLITARQAPYDGVITFQWEYQYAIFRPLP